MRSNLNQTVLQNKIKIDDFVSMYEEGSKFFKYFGSALGYAKSDMLDKAKTIKENV